MEGESAAFRLHEWTVEPVLNRMSVGEATVQVEPRVMRLLVYLAARPGAVVSRETLLADVWDDVVVNEEALTRAVSELRKMFADDPREPRFIETIRGTGYRLVAPVEPAVPDAESAEPPAPAAAPRRRWVLPAALAGVAVLLVALAVWGRAADPSPARLLEAAPFTSYPGSERQPALSPDGARVAFVWRSPEAADEDLYVKQANMEVPLRLTEMPGYEGRPAWSPDGATVAFAHAHDGAYALYTVPALGGVPRKLLDLDAPAAGLDWSPDGASLVYAVRESRQAPLRLFLLPLASRAPRPLTDPAPHLAGDVTPAFSPDGATVAFVRSERAGTQDLFVVPVAGGEPRRLTDGELGLRGVDWLDDGRLVFASYRGGTYGLWRLDVETGAVGWVPARGERLYHPTAAAGNLVYEEQWYEKNVWRIHLDAPGGSAVSTEPVLVSTRWDCEAYEAPDGRRLVFTSSRSGPLELWLSAPDGTDPVRLTHFDGPFVGNPRWSPEGGRVAFYAAPEGRASVYVVDAEGGDPVRLTDGTANDWVTGWSPDGRDVFFASDREGGWQLWRIPADGGRAVQVTSDGALNAEVSSDGRFLYYVRPGRPGLWRRPMVEGRAGEPVEQVLEALGPADWGNWALRDEGLYFVRRTPEGPVVAFHDFATGAARDVASLPNIASPSLAVAADGRSLLYARIERNESDLRSAMFEVRSANGRHP